MKKGVLLFIGGMVLVIALFIPFSVLQDSSAVAEPRKPKGKGSKLCTPFQKPQAVVGEFFCAQKRKSKYAELHACRLVCPDSMTVRPRKHRVMYRCHKGQWAASNNDVHCVALKSVSIVEQHLAPPKLINSLLASYLNHSNNYLAMAYFFDRADVQLPGFHKYFLTLWQTSLDMSRDIMAYINKRGGWIDMQDVPRSRLPEILYLGHREGRVGLVAMETAVSMERELQQQILRVVEQVEKRRKQDPHLVHTLEHKHLDHKVKMIKELSDYLTQLRAFQQSGPGDYELGEYDIDNNLQ